MHAWDDPFQQVVALAARHPVTTPMMGERIDIAAPHAGQRWWRQPHAAGAGQQPRMGDSRA